MDLVEISLHMIKVIKKTIFFLYKCCYTCESKLNVLLLQIGRYENSAFVPLDKFIVFIHSDENQFWSSKSF